MGARVNWVELEVNIGEPEIKHSETTHKFLNKSEVGPMRTRGKPELNYKWARGDPEENQREG